MHLPLPQGRSDAVPHPTPNKLSNYAALARDLPSNFSMCGYRVPSFVSAELCTTAITQLEMSLWVRSELFDAIGQCRLLPR